jgi:hypothetical protein
MNKRFIAGTAVTLTLSVALLSGCGGGGDSTETASQPSQESSSQARTKVTKVVLKPQAPLTRAQFIKRADPVCAKSYEERGDILFKYTHRTAPLSQSKQEQLISQVILPSFRHDLESLEALAKKSAPKGDEAKLEALLEAFSASLAEAEENPELILAGAPKQFAEVTKLARDYGFQVCGSF